MSAKFFRPFSTPLFRKSLIAVGFVTVVVLLLLWLAGTFHEKIDTAASYRGEEVSPLLARSAAGAQLVPARYIEVPSTETAVGTVRAVHETSVAAKLLAKVEVVNVKAGARVKKDQILIQLDDADLQARQKQAASARDGAASVRDQARIEFDRIDGLFKEGHASKIEFDRASTALRSAEAELQRAEQAKSEAATILDYAVIKSPIDGVVIDKQVEIGDTVVPGQTLVTLFDPTRMQLVASVRESLTRRLTVGQDIPVQIDALAKQCVGNVSEIVPEAESASRTFSVKVTGPCPPGIYSGMFGRLYIPLDPRRVLVIPRAAVRRVGQLDIVDVAESSVSATGQQSEPVLRRRAVQLGRVHGEDVEVLSGLQEGEQVAVPHDQGPRDGDVASDDLSARPLTVPPEHS